MSLASLSACLLLFSKILAIRAFYVPLREYAGQSFFSGWDFYGNVDNTTWGNVTYLDQQHATSQRLAYINNAGHAIIRVDNTTNVQLDSFQLAHRPSIRLTSRDTYGVGTLWIIDVLHLPYGCSVWPSFWSFGIGKEWPHGGEIDIIEGINLQGNNQMALHTDAGCAQAPNNGQTGQTIEGDCSQDKGCVVAETKPNSFGQAFAQAGGGAFAVQMDVSGVYIWFWSRPDIPAVIKNANSQSSMDPTLFGPPSASYPATGCNITNYFTAQQLILTTTLCGSWAGVQSIYASSCPNTGTCVSNVIGPGSPKYDNAFWEISYLRTYIVSDLASPSNSSTSTSSSSSSAPASSSTSTGTSGPSEVIVTQTTTASPSPSRSSSSGALASERGTLLTTLLLAFSALLFIGN